MEGVIVCVLIFSVPLIRIVTSHLQKTQEMKRDMIRDQVELEKLRNENFILETEK
ncbi:hypothetical protein [Bacillus testis]|uniref:hypothetical protein n=1 Tax=Bacillus testis TaxID=1622072 RepID=UPI000AA9AE4B|nr:hypothetical protein [Bacillus testis]